MEKKNKEERVIRFSCFPSSLEIFPIRGNQQQRGSLSYKSLQNLPVVKVKVRVGSVKGKIDEFIPEVYVERRNLILGRI
ncbi:hypothetical protein Bca4012_040321 [Brassica carinata]